MNNLFLQLFSDLKSRINCFMAALGCSSVLSLRTYFDSMRSLIFSQIESYFYVPYNVNRRFPCGADSCGGDG